MADDYISDREQEEALRNWWRENWRWIFGGIALGVALLLGWRFLESYREQRAERAAQLYSDFRTAFEAKDAAKAEQTLKSLSDDFDSSGYAQQARLLLAKMHVEGDRLEEAVLLLRAVIDKSEDEEMAQIARLRLARIQVQLGKHDEALALLDTEKAGEFVSQVREIRGDARFAKGDKEGARAEYAAALTGGSDAPIDRTILELKLQEVGGSTAEQK